MGNTFLAKVEPYILSDDKFLRDFALFTLDNSQLGTEQTFFYALQALDKLEPHPMMNPILPYTKHMPVTENVLKEVIRRLNKKDDNYPWYSTIIERCDTALIAKYQHQLSPFVNKEALETIVSLRWMDTEQLFKEVTGIMNSLEDGAFNQHLFDFGKRIFKELIHRGEFDEENYWEIEAAIKEERDEEFFSFHGIYHVYLAGEQKVTSLIPQLTALLPREEEDFLLEEVLDALIKIGTPEVIPEVEKYVTNEDSSIFAIGVLENIKHPDAEEMLLHHFDQTTNISLKTLIAEALCRQLSTQAIPKVAALIEEGYDETLLDLKEPLYANCVINGVPHPKLEEWKKELLEKDAYWQEQRKERARQDAKRAKIGRNDPCPCGSGKKFKKCCGK
ncbi:SEC-C metal-binding domain-containing protein [Oceanobacillus salinisoli]|uniref:SEC-C metal-binding domain-containing protein n=1 Tax=Oceanobacillus salinisoli TaxID=2678611 RepID=UPI0022AED7BC|nr:SEC-C metal-binding domain-containing protein [Oceanobacillus salinisoli]